MVRINGANVDGVVEGPLRITTDENGNPIITKISPEEAGRVFSEARREAEESFNSNDLKKQYDEAQSRGESTDVKKESNPHGTGDMYTDGQGNTHIDGDIVGGQGNSVNGQTYNGAVNAEFGSPRGGTPKRASSTRNSQPSGTGGGAATMNIGGPVIGNANIINGSASIPGSGEQQKEREGSDYYKPPQGESVPNDDEDRDDGYPEPYQSSQNSPSSDVKDAANQAAKKILDDPAAKQEISMEMWILLGELLTPPVILIGLPLLTIYVIMSRRDKEKEKAWLHLLSKPQEWLIIGLNVGIIFLIPVLIAIIIYVGCNIPGVGWIVSLLSWLNGLFGGTDFCGAIK